MRYVFISFLLLLITVTGYPQNIIVKGKLNVPDSSIIVLTDGVEADTAFTAVGSFYLTSRTRGLLLSLSGYDRKGNSKFRREFFAEEGLVTIDSNLIVRLSNPELQLKYEEFKKRYDPLMKVKNAIIRTYSQQKKTADTRVLFDSIYNKVIDLTQDMVRNFITENTNNLLGPYIFTAYFQTVGDPQKLDDIYRLFDNKLYDRSYALQMMKAKTDLMHSLLPGNMAPFFSATSSSGKNVSTISLKGKFVVLDYWATWCNPCVLGLPKMKQYYAKYKDQVEFVSIACHDNTEGWRNAITKYNLTWPQIFNIEEKEGLESKYNVVKYPTKIIIDPAGHLVKIFTGELADFYIQLDELLAVDKTISSVY